MDKKLLGTICQNVKLTIFKKVVIYTLTFFLRPHFPKQKYWKTPKNSENNEICQLEFMHILVGMVVQ